MAKFSVAILAALVATASAFVSPKAPATKTALKAGEGVWDPLSLMELGKGEAFDTFPNVFPHEQFLRDAELKHGRMSMLAWTGVWATSKVGVRFDEAVICCLLLCFLTGILYFVGFFGPRIAFPWLP